MKQLTMAVLFLLLLQACQKDKPNPEPPASSTPSEYFFPMKTGNYWIYKITDFNYSTPTVTYDTLRVIGDTSINGITFYQLKTSNMQNIHNGSFITDSSGYLIYLSGDRFPLSTLENDTLAAYTADNGMDYRVYRSGNLDTTITVAAGSFQTIETVLDFYYLNNGSPYPHIPNPRPVLNYFSKNIGLIKCITWYASGQGDIVSELQSYHIQP